MEWQLKAVLASSDCQLRLKCLGINANAHTANLNRRVQGLVPEQQIAVERPVVVVGRPKVVRLTGVQSAANAHDKRGWMLANKQIFSLLRRLGRVEVLQLLRGYKGNFATELGVELGIVPLELVERAADCLDNATGGVFQRVGVALILRDDALPVPLVHVNGVQVIGLFVTTNSVHVAD